MDNHIKEDWIKLRHMKHLGNASEERKPLRRHRCKEEDNIKMKMRVTGCKGVNWIHLAEYTVQWRAVMNIVICLWFV